LAIIYRCKLGFYQFGSEGVGSGTFGPNWWFSC